MQKTKNLFTSLIILTAIVFMTTSSMAGDEINCYLAGKKLLIARDDTFNDAGMLGLWTKADAATSFDSLVAHPYR